MKRASSKKSALTFNMDASQLCVPVLQPHVDSEKDTSGSPVAPKDSTANSANSDLASPSTLRSNNEPALKNLADSGPQNSAQSIPNEETNANFYLANEADELAAAATHNEGMNSSRQYGDSEEQEMQQKRVNATYEPVEKHWFYNTTYEGRTVWTPFSKADSEKLEYAHISQSALPISVEGGRFDVLVPQRKRKAVYWSVPTGEIRRASWFIRYAADDFFVPFDEQTAEELEREYANAVRSKSWPRRIEMTNGAVVFHNELSLLFYFHTSADDLARRPSIKPMGANSSETPTNLTSEDLARMEEAPKLAGLEPRLPTSVSLGSLSSPASAEPAMLQNDRAGTVLRGIDQFEIDSGEADRIAHLVFVVHGIGPVCDLRGHSVYECVDALRTAAQKIASTHFPQASCQQNASDGASVETVGRVEFLPVFWHSALHSDVTDRQLATLTLPTVPKLRDFTNRTLMDVLFYASPRFGASIREAVANEVNRLYEMFMQRNAGWHGHVSVAGHSLGSVILFDLLANQPSPIRDADDVSAEPAGWKPTSLVNELLATEQPASSYPVLKCDRLFCFFAIGSPLSLFLTARGVRELPADFHLATCRRFFSIFHPFDPVAYRIEPLLDVSYGCIPPVTLPHHKGRKRLHLELKEGFARGTEVTQKVVSTLKSTFQSIFNFGKAVKKPDELLAGSGAPTPSGNPTLQQTSQTDNAEQIAKIVEATIACLANNQSDSERPLPLAGQSQSQPNAFELPAALNGGRRIDYQLQESPWESMNEYLGCVAAHTCYWESLDTALFLLTELYAVSGLAALPPAAFPLTFPSSSSLSLKAAPNRVAAPLRTKNSARTGEAAGASESECLSQPAAPLSENTEVVAQAQPAANGILQTGFGLLKSYMQKPRPSLSGAPPPAQLVGKVSVTSEKSTIRYSELQNSPNPGAKKDADAVIDFG